MDKTTMTIALKLENKSINIKSYAKRVSFQQFFRSLQSLSSKYDVKVSKHCYDDNVVKTNQSRFWRWHFEQSYIRRLLRQPFLDRFDQMCLQHNIRMFHVPQNNVYTCQSSTTNYTNVAYYPLTYNMATATTTIQSNSKWRHCHPMNKLVDRRRVFQFSLSRWCSNFMSTAALKHWMS